jgi:hypothetical protein
MLATRRAASLADKRSAYPSMIRLSIPDASSEALR